MSFYFWATTVRQVSLEKLGVALAELAPDVVASLPAVPPADSQSLDVLASTGFGWRIDDEQEVGVPLSLDVSDEGAGVHLSFVRLDDFGFQAVALALCAAALRVGGGSYGDESDRVMTPKRVLAEFRRERDQLRSTWERLSPEAREGLTHTSRQARLEQKVAALCVPGREAALGEFVRAEGSTPAVLALTLRAAWRAENSAAARSALASAPAAEVHRVLGTALEFIGLTAVRQASFLLEDADALSLLDPDARSSLLARAPFLPDSDMRALIEQVRHSDRSG